ncbi:MAG: MHYT domain-containing protein [Ramlibacter sp.]
MAFNVGDVLPAHHDMATVLVSYVVSLLGSYSALFHAQHMFRANGSINRPVAIGAAVSLGGVGIWTTHFTGMMAYILPVTVVYEGFLTTVSLIAAIVISGIALLLAGGRGTFSVRGWIVGSILAALGVCVMHYMGVYAMTLRAVVSLNWGVVAASLAIAIVAAAAALWLVFHARKTSHRFAASVAMASAVCAVHYTGMSAAEFICASAAPKSLWSIGGYDLPVLVFAVTGLVLVWLGWNALGVLSQNQMRRRTPASAGSKTPTPRDELRASARSAPVAVPGRLTSSGTARRV